MADTSPIDPLATLSGLYQDPTAGYTGVLVQLVSLPPLSGPEWRLEFSLDNGNTWSTPEPRKPGYSTPKLAIENGSPLISSVRSVKSNNEHIEISSFFSSGKLKREEKEIQDEEGKTSIVIVFHAKSEDGIWVEDSEPIKAIERAKQVKSSHRSSRLTIPPTSNL